MPPWISSDVVLRGHTCRVVVRDPIPAEGKPLSWKRVVAGGGIGVLPLLGTR